MAISSSMPFSLLLNHSASRWLAASIQLRSAHASEHCARKAFAPALQHLPLPGALSDSLLPSDGRWIVQQEVAWTASGVVRISDLSCGRASCAGAATLAILAMRKRGLIIGATPLPADAAWTAAQRAVAAIAITIVVQTASADQQ